MLTGHLPVLSGPNALAVMRAKPMANRTAQLLSRFDPSLRPSSRNPRDRYQTAAELRQAWRRF